MIEIALGWLQSAHYLFFHYRKLDSFNQNYAKILTFFIFLMTFSFFSVIHVLITYKPNLIFNIVFSIFLLTSWLYIKNRGNKRAGILAFLILLIVGPYFFVLSRFILKHIWVGISSLLIISFFHFYEYIESFMIPKIKPGLSAYIQHFSSTMLMPLLTATVYAVIALKIPVLTKLFPSGLFNSVPRFNFTWKFDLFLFLIIPVILHALTALFEYVSKGRELDRDYFSTGPVSVSLFTFFRGGWFLFFLSPLILLATLFRRGKNRILDMIEPLKIEDETLEVITGSPITSLDKIFEKIRKELLFAKGFGFLRFFNSALFWRDFSSDNHIFFTVSPVDMIKGPALELNDKLRDRLSHIVIEGKKKYNKWLVKKFRNSVLNFYLSKCSSEEGKELEIKILNAYENSSLNKDSQYYQRISSIREELNRSNIPEDDESILEKKLSISNRILAYNNKFIYQEVKNAKKKIISAQKRFESSGLYNYQGLTSSRRKFLEYFLIPSMNRIRKVDFRLDTGDSELNNLIFAEKANSSYEYMELGLDLLEQGSISEKSIEKELNRRINQGRKKLECIYRFLKDLKCWESCKFSSFIEKALKSSRKAEKDFPFEEKIEILVSKLGKIATAKSLIVEFLLRIDSEEERSGLIFKIREEKNIKQIILDFCERMKEYSYLRGKRSKKIKRIISKFNQISRKIKGKEAQKREKEMDKEKSGEQRKKKKNVLKSDKDLEKKVKKFFQKNASIFSFDEVQTTTNDVLEEHLMVGALITPSKNILKIVKPEEYKKRSINKSPDEKNLMRIRFNNLFQTEVEEYGQNLSSDEGLEIYKVIMDKEIKPKRTKSQYFTEKDF